jgi:hypothetical protein
MNRDLKHGASHLACPLSYGPGNPEWIELLERYLAAAGPDPESLNSASAISWRWRKLDWTTGAAIQVLSRLGRENEAIAPDVHNAFQRLADHRPDEGYWCCEHTLYSYWLELPHLFPKEREELQRKLCEIESHAAPGDG